MASTRVSWPSSTFASLGKILQRTHLREHVHDFLERSHLANLLELIAEIFQREFFFAQLALEIGGGLFVHRLLHPFDERHDVAHAENPRDDAFWIKTLERVVFFTEADKLYRRASNFADLPILSAAPPRASPSSFVRITPVRPSRL